MLSPAGTIVEQVDRLITQAIEEGASDIHIEPTGYLVRVRYRLDGMLREVATLPGTSAQALAARLKVMASLDTAERRRPQDGRIAFQHGVETVDLRMSVVPTTAGEKVVLRVLDRRSLRLDFDALGLEGESRATLERALARPHGLVLVTGPTGSGKTTTLYAALRSLDRDRLNVMTVEDPVEYDVEGVSQVAARSDLDFGFPEALRAFLRQDPDVILVGEIRDAETARIAVRAALTGHLVLATLHTNDAASASARLIDMGVEPYLLAASLRLVVAQRLVRLLCPKCAVPAEDVSAEGAKQPVGCDACHQTGYKGRTAVYEMLEVDETFSSLIARGATAAEIRRVSESAGNTRLRSRAESLLRSGRISREEVLRVSEM